jgi:hypothetical protein
MRSLLLILFKLSLPAVLFVACAVLGSVGYHQFAPPSQTCLKCHQQHQDDLAARTPHRQLACTDCHNGRWYAGLHGADQQARALLGASGGKSVAGQFAARRQSRQTVVQQTHDSCRACHPNHYQNWLAGGHSLTYADCLLDPLHNQTEQLNEDCLRCHGMFFDGPIEAAVEPLNIEGPWRLKQAGLAHQPAIPCSACHRVHAEAARPDTANQDLPAARQRRPEHLGSVGLYSRIEQTWFAAEDLPRPPVQYQGQPVVLAEDPVQRNCIQCHATDSFHHAGTSDDRTPMGVHEGLRCLACHRTHSQDARSSCAACHPRLSNCGLDVTQMDTSFADPDSPHDIHTVRCRDCHPEMKR